MKGFERSRRIRREPLQVCNTAARRRGCCHVIMYTVIKPARRAPRAASRLTRLLLPHLGAPLRDGALQRVQRRRGAVRRVRLVLAAAADRAVGADLRLGEPAGPAEL